MASNQIAVDILRGQLKFSHDWLEGTLQGVTSEIAHWLPQGKVHPIDSQYIHVLTSEDFLVNALIAGGAPLMATSFMGKAGFDEAPPQGNREDWAKRVKVDMTAARAYAQAVYAATDQCLAGMTETDLMRSVDMSMVGMGMQPVSFIFGLLILNANNHCGEISCLKGLHGLQGYPG